MNLKDCNRCALASIREHTAYPKGNKPSSVFIIFDREPKTDQESFLLNGFISKLRVFLKEDYYYTFAAKCHQTQIPVKLEHIIKCRDWLKTELKIVNPYLIVVMGDLSRVALLGKMARFVKPDVFYVDKEGKKKEIFIGHSIYGDAVSVKESLEKLVSFIKEYYIHD